MKYIKISKKSCNHSSKYRIFYNFKLKQPLTNKISSGYKNDVYESEKNNGEVINEDEIEKEE